MNLPSFLRPIASLVAPAAQLATTPMGGAAVPLSFAMQHQQETNWCWAATTASVSSFFDTTSTWTQCAVAAQCLSSTCCVDPAPCNFTFTLDDPLRATGNLQEPLISGAIQLIDIDAAIARGAPVCCHINWTGGGGHFVALSGCDVATTDVFVEDPLYGQKTVPYSSFVNAYRGSGQWDFTYQTQA